MRAYVVLEDVARDEGLVDTRVLVRLQVLKRIFGDTLMLRGLCTQYQQTLLCAHSYSLGFFPQGVLTSTRRHSGMGGRRWQRHEGCASEFINALVRLCSHMESTSLAGVNCMQM